MQKDTFLRMIEELTETPPNTLRGNETLRDIAGWDSLAIVDFISRVDEEFEVQFSGQAIGNCRTVNDLAALLGDRIQG